jgi:hypothetical protein
MASSSGYRLLREKLLRSETLESMCSMRWRCSPRSEMSENLRIALDVRLLQNMVSGEIPASNFSRCCMTPGLEPGE